MATLYKLIPQIETSEMNWSAKVIIVGKQSPKTARNSTTRYENIVFMDLEGNQVTAMLYDANITALNDQLDLGKTYVFSNATVTDNKSQFRSFADEKIWTITGRTKIEELHENNLNFVFVSTYSI
ncbi:Hypothetical predicted protein [Olea europaea subsp. europaea]|uniref:Uncharacterized protein n=1 Tax=Olea europaea subsp. europaea TaxID=158383 RepID=A0A8S0T7Y6_OLEEU|nr:Hypothetical predicted protein [Olea europaea subsp. europaea]